MTKRTRLVAGNWKMNGSHAANIALVTAVARAAAPLTNVEVVVCPPFVYLDAVARALDGSRVALGAQSLADQPKPGAFTGEIHGAMLKDVGCRFVIVGHSERRTFYGERDGIVARKFGTALASGLTPILCIGELLEERENGQAEVVLARQLGTVVDECGIATFAGAVLAYEPVWAIGTGRNATPEQAQQAHAFIRGMLRAKDAKIADSIRILYGGSVKGDNARTLFAGADVDGGLIGGASLKADEFAAICQAAQA
jgi:triosephosphate isomerase (TIM)